MKKILSFVLVIGMLMALLVGCSSGTQAPTAPAAPAAPAATTPAAPAAPAAPAKVDFPTHAITYIIPWAPGGASDITARLLAAEAEKTLGVPIVCQNEGGGAAWIGWNDMLKAAPDGYTVAQAALPTLTAGYLNPDEKRTNTAADFAPLVNVARDYCTFCINATDTRFKTIQEFITYAKTHDITVGCGSAYSDDHIFLLKMNEAFGINMVPPFQQGRSRLYEQYFGQTC